MPNLLADTAALLVLIAAISFATSLFFIAIKHRIPWLNGRLGDTIAVQAAHKFKTPRIGGVGLFCSVALGIALAPAIKVEPYIGLFVAATFLFAVGLAEDIGLKITPSHRMAATLLASLLVIATFGGGLPRVDIPFVDTLMGNGVFATLMTLLITAGITNGFNLIDGVNGLAALTGIIASVTLALIAQQVSYDSMVILSLLIAAGLLGFLVLNFPFGLIFLGDAGAYATGFVLAWIGIAILTFSADVSAWAILLTVFWPLADTLIAIYRRRRRQNAAMSPDRLHVHHMVMRALEICYFGRGKRHIANPVTTAVLLPFVAAPPITGVLLWDQNYFAFVAVVSYCGLFAFSYLISAPIIRRFRR